MYQYFIGNNGKVASKYHEDTDGSEDVEDDNKYDDDDGPSLKEVITTACKRIDIGAAVLPEPLFGPSFQSEDAVAEYDEDSTAAMYATLQDSTTAPLTKYGKAIKQEFNSIVVENHLKWTSLCASHSDSLTHERPCNRLGRYDFTHADAIMDWATQHNIKVRGHVLVWHGASPVSALEGMSANDVAEAVRRHIFTTMGHCRGRVQVWDVVSGALAADGTLAETIFKRKMGPNYIEQCFKWAHEADPKAVLLYTDNTVEGMDGPNARKAEGFYQLLAKLKHDGCPVHGCGIQAHFNAAGVGTSRPPTPRMVKNQIHRLGNLGLSVSLSEMDVRVSNLPPHLQSMAQTQIYRDIIAAALTEPAFDGIWLWGVSDKHTWVHSFYGDATPLLLDEEFGRKDSYYGVREALLSLTIGGGPAKNPIGCKVPLNHDDIDARTGEAWGHTWTQPDP